MYDKKWPSEEDSSASIQVVDRKGETSYVKVESSSSENAQNAEQSGNSIPPGHYRQGYCSCCQVHYINLVEHLASDNHRQLSICNRNRLGTNMLMERFLQDVHQYHPQNYHDTRPTYDDIPETKLLSCTKEDQLCSASFQTQTSEPPSSMVLSQSLGMNNACGDGLKYNYGKMAFTQSHDRNPEQGHSSRSAAPHQSILNFNSKLTSCSQSEGKAVYVGTHLCQFNTIPLDSASHEIVKNNNFVTPHSLLCGESSKNKETNYRKGKRYSGLNVTACSTTGLQNKQLHSQGSCYDMTSGTLCGVKNTSQEEKDNILRDYLVDKKQRDATGKCGRFKSLKDKEINLVRGNKTTVDDIIDQVIWKYCHESSSGMLQEGDKESILSLNVQSIINYTDASSLSFDLPLKFEEEHSKIDLDVLKESSVNVDEDYKSKLKSVLRTSPLTENVIKSDPEEEILLALPHVPPSFVGKTWSQVMHEDDLKIEALVKQFRKGKFHCYFEDAPFKNSGCKRHRKNRETENKCELKIEDLKESESFDVLPLLDHHSDIDSIKSEKPLQPKLPTPCKRTWRQASRCQVVKVSHATQTSLVNFPVVKKKVLKNEQQGVFDFVEEKTPDMKTRMCALKLPKSYTKILTPLQPKTMVYVLSHPDVKPSTGKAASVYSRGRNKCSTDSRDSVLYTYKQSTLKYYDPLTNRILKTPPRNLMRGMGIKKSCVRKLFRTLSSDVNVDKQDFEQKESSISKKSLSSCSVGSLQLESSKGKGINSSIKGCGSSVSTELIGTAGVKSDKPYANFSLSPFNTSFSQATEDIQHSSMITKSIAKSLKPKKVILRESSKSSTRITRARIEPRVVRKAKDNPHRMVKKLAQGKATSNKQPRKKSSVEVAKSNRGIVQTFETSKKLRDRSSQQSAGKHEKVLVKSQFVPQKPEKKKANISKAVSKKNTQIKYQDKIVRRSRRKVSEGLVHSTINYLRSRHKASTTDSNSRTKRMTRRTMT
ncbi:DBF4-type zinc finger-containing protein 2 [Hyla sarda]|uniref:DBF4-type zinc finger-containing protein 2 n=1 Tax=Hyla sarda TaxID=327740 RepID=UPI0024C3BCDD|nr:DBF4-type zinc finger-containing protein 2 [Hyla sarda]XP_056389353.1 DBF4-type zinc finger-containing protein 2 [Hyla sarda]XP_056389354.1 DBF4-type zinc finger-containing protein 2 [Hyla sarda]XP_056389355.1 DBF4-type zinc finger-containing protein 2 [Hyla sarda]